MCGRFILDKPSSDISNHFGFNLSFDMEPQYNIAPSQNILAVRENNEPVLLRWGLIPPWAKDSSIGHRMINARCETVAEKPSFKKAYRSQRCLIPATGFYEWRKLNKLKQPYLIRKRDAEIFSFAGLWETWADNTSDRVINSCTIITTESNKAIASIHHRMPVIIKPEGYQTWLSNKPAQELFEIAQNVDFEIDPVSSFVNNPKNNAPKCVQKINLEG